MNLFFLFDSSFALKANKQTNKGMFLFSRLAKRLKSEALKSDFTIDLKHEVGHD
jgi:hypothetical protein